MFKYQRTINLNNLKRITKEIGEPMNDEELKDLLSKVAGNGTEITFDEFYKIMTKKSFI